MTSRCYPFPPSLPLSAFARRYENLGPFTQCLERYNKRCSKEHLLGKGLPEQLILDTQERTGKPITLSHPMIPMGALVVAQSMLTSNKHKIVKGKGDAPHPTKLPTGTIVYTNTIDFKNENITQARIDAFEMGLDGRFAEASSLDEFKGKFKTLDKVEKMPNGKWCAFVCLVLHVSFFSCDRTRLRDVLVRRATGCASAVTL